MDEFYIDVIAEGVKQGLENYIISPPPLLCSVIVYQLLSRCSYIVTLS